MNRPVEPWKLKRSFGRSGHPWTGFDLLGRERRLLALPQFLTQPYIGPPAGIIGYKTVGNPLTAAG
ncbi:MAG: hypothetical protein ACRENB_13895 [Gemmatimonadales bacterium]